jgi:F0F1-type ATP synthase assembly protein I
VDATTTTDPVRLVSYTFAASSLAGLAALLRSGQEITPRQLAAATLSAGLLGAGIMLVWWDWMDGRYPWFMMGVSLLAGLGGVNMLEFFIQLVQQAARAYVMRAADNLPLPDGTRTPTSTHTCTSTQHDRTTDRHHTDHNTGRDSDTPGDASTPETAGLSETDPAPR